MRSPETGNYTLAPYTGSACGLFSDSATDVDSGSDQGGIFYTNAADLAPYIGTGTFNLPGSTIADISVRYFGGSVLAFLNTYGWSNATITYTYDDARCLSGYKIDGCTGLPLSGWKIIVNNSTHEWNDTTDVNGFWEICQLENDTYTVCEVLKPGWAQTPSPSAIRQLWQESISPTSTSPTRRCTASAASRRTTAPAMPLPGWNITIKQ